MIIILIITVGLICFLLGCKTEKDNSNISNNNVITTQNVVKNDYEDLNNTFVENEEFYDITTVLNTNTNE